MFLNIRKANISCKVSIASDQIQVEFEYIRSAVHT